MTDENREQPTAERGEHPGEQPAQTASDSPEKSHEPEDETSSERASVGSVSSADEVFDRVLAAVLEDPTPQEEAGYDLRLRISQFQWTIEALRELSDAMLPQAQELDAPQLGPSAKEAVARLPKDKREQLGQLLREVFSPKKGGDEDGDTRDEETQEPLGARILRVFGNDLRGFHDFSKGFAAMVMSPARVHLVGSSLLTTAVAAYEVLVAGVVSKHFVLFPSALDEEQKEFSLEDLRNFETIRDAENDAIDRRVDSIMRDGFERWKKWLVSRLQCEFTAICLDEAQLTELFQRRHLIVHSAGKVSRQYLDV